MSLNRMFYMVDDEKKWKVFSHLSWIDILYPFRKDQGLASPLQ